MLMCFVCLVVLCLCFVFFKKKRKKSDRVIDSTKEHNKKWKKKRK